MSELCEPLKPTELPTFRMGEHPDICERADFAPGSKDYPGFDVLGLYKQATNSLVRIRTYIVGHEDLGYGEGNGFIVEMPGGKEVITNKHVADWEGAPYNPGYKTRSVAITPDGKEYRLKLHPYQPVKFDAAVLDFVDRQPLHVPGLKLGHFSGPGEKVIAIGYPPYMAELPAPPFVSLGTVLFNAPASVSLPIGAQPGFLSKQQIIQGESGSPQFNSEGKVVGVVFGTTGYKRNEDSHSESVPIDKVAPFLDHGYEFVNWFDAYLENQFGR